MLIRSFILILLIFTVNLFANVQISIPNSVVKGEPLVFSISVYGNSLKFPNLSLIDGNSVQEISSTSSTNIINGKITKQIKKLYSLYPTSNVKFPSLTFEVDSQKFYTKEKEVVLLNPEKTKSNIFDLEIISEKNEVYVGESFILKLVFKYKKYSQIVDLSFEQPNFQNFWFKQLNETKKYEENDYVVQELNFLLFPLKKGLLEISPLKIQAQVIDASKDSYSLFSRASSNVNIYSNSLSIKSKKLPDGVDLVGNFNIRATVDKKDIKKGESISYRVEIDGVGNIDDVKDIKLNIPDATVYENKPEIKSSFKNNSYGGTYIKVFSIIPNKSITIPSVKLKYFNKEDSEVIVKNSENYTIKVKDIQVSSSYTKLEKAVKNDESKQVIKVVEKSSLKNNILYFSLGIIVTLLILGLYWYVINSKKQKVLDDISLVKKVKSSKTKDELLKTLAVYININQKLDELIFKLEKSEDIKDIKKEIISLLKHIDIKR